MEARQRCFDAEFTCVFETENDNDKIGAQKVYYSCGKVGTGYSLGTVNTLRFLIPASGTATIEQNAATALALVGQEEAASVHQTGPECRNSRSLDRSQVCFDAHTSRYALRARQHRTIAHRRAKVLVCARGEGGADCRVGKVWRQLHAALSAVPKDSLRHQRRWWHDVESNEYWMRRIHLIDE